MTFSTVHEPMSLATGSDCKKPAWARAQIISFAVPQRWARYVVCSWWLFHHILSAVDEALCVCVSGKKTKISSVKVKFNNCNDTEAIRINRLGGMEVIIWRWCSMCLGEQEVEASPPHEWDVSLHNAFSALFIHLFIHANGNVLLEVTAKIKTLLGFLCVQKQFMSALAWWALYSF